MREIREVIFRGKRTDNGELVEGILFNAKEDTFIIPHGNEYSYDPIEGLAFDVYGCKVDPETVGQYTGLTDKNGVRIFEGDILDVSSDVAYGGVAVHRLGYFVVEFHNGCFMKSALDDPQLSFFDNAKRKGLYHFISTDIHKIVGNIHDNPEILKGGGDNG